MSLVEHFTAQKLYNNYIYNHPNINTRNFSPWAKLPQTAKDEWLKKARKRIEYENDDGA